MQSGRLVGNRFEIEARAGAGGMGTVYRARDTLTGGAVAIKVLQGAGAQHAGRFAREARVLSELRHPAIVHYVAHGATDTGEPFLAMEWLDGEDLARRLEREPLTFADTLGMMRRVADALAAVHSRGVVHRDLKPSNLFLPGGNPAEVKLLDFGIARIDRTARVTRTGLAVGTPGYMAPEQARGARDVDARADVFSMGCVLFECLAGRPAFVGEHVMALLAKILLEEAPRLDEVRPDLPRAVVELVARMLSKDAALRPADAAAARDALIAVDDGAASSLPVLPHLPPSVPPSLTHEEQQLVSVVVTAPPKDADEALASTPRAGEEQLVRAVLDRALAPFGARVEWLADGSLVVALTARGAATDQAVRAARCGLALRGHLPGLSMVVATGRGVFSGRVPLGEVIDRAVRLLRLVAPRGSEARPQIALDDVTAGLLPARFSVTEGPIAPELHGERRLGAAPRTLLGRPTPFVGREHELDVLLGIVRRTSSDRVARAALVTGAPGVGKTRLRDELVRALGEGDPGRTAIWLAVGDPMRAGAPLGLVTDALRRVFGIVDDDPLETCRDKIRTRVEQRIRAEDVGRVAAFLGEICGVGGEDADDEQLTAARGDLMLMGEQMRRAWVDFVRAEASAGPLVVLVEDMHWGDAPTTKYLEVLLRELRSWPIAIVAFARPEVDELFPKLWAGRGLTRVDLAELPASSCEALARHVLGPSASASAIARLVEQSAGNAFFLEELIRAAAEGRDELPGTVVAMVQARLAALEDGARRVLRGASVFGQVFWRGGVSALFGGNRVTSDLHEWLDDLVEREIVVSRGEGRFRGDVELEFRHGVVRDAAYALLTEEDRRLGHRLAGEWLEGMGEREAAVLAEHFERGGERPRAIEQYRRAAAHAFQGNDLDGAVALAERGVACGAEGEAFGALRLLQADAHYFRGRQTEAVRAGREAQEALPSRSAAWYASLATTVAAADKAGDAATAAELEEKLRVAPTEPALVAAYVNAAARCVAHALTAARTQTARALLLRIDEAEAREAFAEPIVVARVLLARAMHAFFGGDLASGYDHYTAAAAEFERAGDLRTACAARGNAGYALTELGAYARAETALRGALDAAERVGLENTSAWVRHNLGVALAQLGRFDEARDVEGRALRAAATLGDKRLEVAGTLAFARIHLLRGDPQSAEDAARRALEKLAAEDSMRLDAIALLATALHGRGKFDEARQLVEPVVPALGTEGQGEVGEARLRLVAAEVAHALGDRSAAEHGIAVARDRLRARAERVKDPELQSSFLRDVPEHARTLELAEQWLGACLEGSQERPSGKEP